MLDIYYCVSCRFHTYSLNRLSHKWFYAPAFGTDVSKAIPTFCPECKGAIMILEFKECQKCGQFQFKSSEETDWSAWLPANYATRVRVQGEAKNQNWHTVEMCPDCAQADAEDALLRAAGLTS